MNKIFIAISFIFVCASCQKLKNENIIPEDQPRLDELKLQYRDLLVSSQDGWYLEYAGSDTEGTVSIWMKFYRDSVTMQSDLHNFNEERTSTYRVGGVFRPELIFDTYSVWSVIAERMGGEFEFYMYPQDNGTIILKYLFVNKDREYILRKATVQDRELIVSKIRTSKLLADFKRNSSAYFNNLIVGDFKAFWDIEVSSQSIQLSYEDQDKKIVTKNITYSNLSNGIRFSRTLNIGSISMDELIFGDLRDNELEIIEAGNAGPGRIESAHVPAFPYANSARRYVFSNIDKMQEEPVRFLGYTVDEEAISPALRPYYHALKNALPTFWRIQVYNYNPITAPRNSLVLVWKNESNSNVWYHFYYNFLQVNSSFLVPTYVEPSSTAAVVANHPDIKAFLNAIYPPEGITIVPMPGQKCRVVSSANSQYYMELTVSTPSNIWSN